MLRISRKVDVADWLTRGTLADMSQVPPSTMNGPMKIGIRGNRILTWTFTPPATGSRNFVLSSYALARRLLLQRPSLLAGQGV
jgi:hypothetical protein